LLGAWLLLLTGDRIFAVLVPWLLLCATMLFALGPRLRAFMPQARGGEGRGLAPLGLCVEFAFAVYGGYFGAGLGVLLMACLALLGHDDLREANALKNLLASVVTSIAVVAFIAAGVIAWSQTLCVLAGAVVGGVIGARVAQRLSPIWLRRSVITVGSILTLHFMWRAYG
jgi:hypothetical protein